jgi:lipoprotein-anchoring transpeptidase ErfK/SrfK
MQRFLVTTFLLTMAGAVPAFAQPMQPGGAARSYYHPQAAAAQPVYPQQQYAQPQYAEPERPNLGGGFIEYIFRGGQTRYGRPMSQSQPGGPQPYVPGQVIQASYPPQQLALDPRYEKQLVDYDGNEPAGTVVISTPAKFLYLVQENGKALRYGIGVGRPGFTWAGMHEVTAKREWPDWRPPKEMLERRPDLPHYMAGGPDNPLGARALYLGSTLYRIHGSNEPWTIGTQVSSGCIRMRNEDVIDLYERVKVGTKVVVI